MPRIAVEASARVSDPSAGFRLDGQAFRHAVRVLRLAVGDVVTLTDGTGTEYACVLERVDREAAFARIVEQRELGAYDACRVHLYCGLLKGEKLDWVLQKATEVGVRAIHFFRSSRAVVRLDGKDAEKRRERWLRIVEAAAAQSGQPAPDVGPVLDFTQAVRDAATADQAVLLWEGDAPVRLGKALRAVASPWTVAVLVGPEGGFDAAEVDEAQQAGIAIASLGGRILRAETAAVVAPAIIAAHYGDLG